jgi:CheY-like chemotaxis protein
MHVLIAEKNLNGRGMLNRILKMEGYEVSVAESGNHAMDLMNLQGAARPGIVLLNVFQCIHPSGMAPAGKISIDHYGEASTPVLTVICSRSGETLADFMSPHNQYCDDTYDLLSSKVKSGMIDRVQQMCGALGYVSRYPSPEGGFNWQRFNMLMDMEPHARM